MPNTIISPGSISDRGYLATRQKLMLAGLYLSKYDLLGRKKLGFESWLEAFNVIGLGLGGRPTSVKGYRDEFDALVSTRRKGWHNRSVRPHCLAIYEQYKELDFEAFTALVRSFFTFETATSEDSAFAGQEDLSSSSFAQRLITGLAAEHYFEAVQPKLALFRGYHVENTTRLGCGYDFRLRPEADEKEFLAVEVKGLKELTGSLSMTPKEYDVAAALKDRFFLFVVRNFRESPSHEIFQNPLDSNLEFRKVERVIVQVSWATSI